MTNRIEPQATSGVGWTLVAICIILSAIRYTLRAFIIRVWYWDDLFHGITLIIFIVQLAVYQALSAFQSGNAHTILQLSAVSTILGYTSLWTTKFAFLFLYRLPSINSKSFTRAWWVVLTATFLTYWAVLGGFLARCDGGPTYLTDRASCQKPWAIERGHRIFIYTYTLNVATDLAIIALPLSCIASLNLSTKRKIGAGALCCVGLLIILFDTLRFAESYSNTLGDEPSFYAFFETAICIIASCCPTLTALAIWKRNGFKSSATTYNGHLRAPGARKNGDVENGTSTTYGKGNTDHLVSAAQEDIDLARRPHETIYLVANGHRESIIFNEDIENDNVA